MWIGLTASIGFVVTGSLCCYLDVNKKVKEGVVFWFLGSLTAVAVVIVNAVTK